MKKVKVKVSQLCPTLCNPMDYTVHGILQANMGTPEYIKQIFTDLKGEPDSNTVVIGDFTTLLTSMDRSSRQIINKETLVLN